MKKVKGKRARKREAKEMEKERQSTIALLPRRPSSYSCHRPFSLTLLAIPFPSLQRAERTEREVVRERERETGRQREKEGTIGRVAFIIRLQDAQRILRVQRAMYETATTGLIE